MRIWDGVNNVAVSVALLFLTREEAEEIKCTIDAMLSDEVMGDYPCLSLDDHMVELDLCLYDDKNMENNPYTPEVIRLLKENK